MSVANQYSQRGRLLRHGEGQGARGKQWFSRSRDFSSATRSLRSESHAAPNHVHRMVAAHNQNIEMSQISQLSMDSLSSSYGTHSHPTGFVDSIPLGQPSIESYSQGHSHSSSISHQQQGCNDPRERFACSEFTSSRNEDATTALNSLHSNSRSSSSSLSRPKRKPSLLTTKKKRRKNGTQKMRFAGPGDDRFGTDAHAMSQGSWGTNLSISACASKSPSRTSAQDSSRSAHRFQAQTPLDTRTLPHLGGIGGANSSYHSPPQEQIRHRNAGKLCALRDMSDNFDHRYERSNDSRPLVLIGSLRRSSSRHPSLSIADRTFAKAATPRKKLDVPYPLLDSQLRQQQHEIRRQQQHQNQINPSNTETAMTGTNKVMGDMLEDNKSKQEKYPLGQEKENRDGNIRTEIDTGTEDGAQGHTHSQSELIEERESGMTSSLNGTPVPAVWNENGKSNTNALSSTSQNCNGNGSNAVTTAVTSQEHQLDLIEPSILETQKKQGMADFKEHLQSLLREMESKSKTNFNEILRTATSCAESKFVEKIKTLQKTTQSELNRNAEALREATTSELDRKAEATQTIAQSNLDQKRSEIEKSIEDLVDSEKNKLEETSIKCVQKLERFTEGSLSRLSKFTEKWIAGSCKKIANSLKPYMSIASETNTQSKEEASDGFGKIPKTTKCCRSDIKSTNSDQVNTKSSRSSKENYSVGQQHSPAENEVSLTQGSNKKGSPKSNGEKAQLRPLRRSKRTRQSRNPNSSNLNSCTPLPKGKGAKNSMKKEEANDLSCPDGKDRIVTSESEIPLAATRKDKALCVTPIGEASGSKQKGQKKLAVRARRRSIAKQDVPRSISHGQKSPHVSPMKIRRPETHRNASKNHVPSEIVAYSNVYLSPLEDPKPVVYNKTIRPRSDIALKTKRTRKPKSKTSIGRSKRRKGGARTYAKRPNHFDMTEKDSFEF